MLTSPVRLFKEAPQENVHREYNVTIVHDLFGAPVVVRRWGRIGACGQRREHVCASFDEAQALAAKLVREKEARGYARERAELVRSSVVRVSKRRQRRESENQLSLWMMAESPVPAPAPLPAPGTKAPATTSRPALPPSNLYDDRRQMWLDDFMAPAALDVAAEAAAVQPASLVFDAVEAQRQSRIDMLVAKSALLMTRKGESLGMKRAVG